MGKLNTGRIFNVERTGLSAEQKGIYTVDARMKHSAIYTMAKGEVAIINHGGAVRLTLEDALKMCEELPTIIKDYKVYARDGRRP